MGGQQLLVMALIAMAGAYLSWRGWRAWRKAANGCAGGCGCASKSVKDLQKPGRISLDDLMVSSNRSSGATHP